MISGMGIRARFTLLYGMALIITVLAVCGGIYFFVQRALLRHIETHLSKDFATIAEYLQSDRHGLANVASRGPILLFTVSNKGQTVITSDDWQAQKLDAILAKKQESGFFTARTADGRFFRIRAGSVSAGSESFTVVTAHTLESMRETLRTLSLLIVLAFPVTIVASLATGYFIAGRVLLPVRNLARKAEEISAENLSERLPVVNPHDEFGRLAIVFNQAFARIEDSFAHLRRFTADASHELRTPLSAIRSIGETALQSPAGQGNCREAIGSILEETDRLRQLIDALLQLSRIDATAHAQQREPVDLAELARETVEFLNVLAEEKNQIITVTEQARAQVLIDRASVRQAVTNLIDNAIKFSAPGKEIAIGIGCHSDHEAVLEIADQGPGIPSDDLPRIFDRFYRVDKGRSREMGGAGLGLAISKWAVESNGGRIEVVSELNQGSVFRVVFPKLA